MRSRSIEFGVFLLSIGIVLFLVNLGIINWSILDGLFDLWPAVFIVLGINVIFKNSSIVRVVSWLLFLGAIVSYGYFFEGGRPWLQNTGKNQIVSIEKNNETEKGELKLALGGTSLTVGSTGSQLVDATVSSPNIKNSVSYKDGKKTAVVEFKREVYNFFGSERIRNDCTFNINDSVVWDMDIDAGAIDGTFDMSELKVENMDIDVGAGKLNLILGDKQPDTFIKIDAGASSFDITVPKGAGLKVKMDGALNNTNLGDLGLNKTGNYYVSPNYDSMKNKIDMDIDMGVGNFNVRVQ